MATLEKPTTTQQEFHKTTKRLNFQIPQSEYIWDAPYLNKTQIFPSFVRIKTILSFLKKFRKYHQNIPLNKC